MERVFKVCKYHDSWGVRSRNYVRGLGPDRVMQDCGDIEADSLRWLTPPPVWPFLVRETGRTLLFFVQFFFSFFIITPLLVWYYAPLNQLFWVRKEAVVSGSLPEMIPFKRWLWLQHESLLPSTYASLPPLVFPVWFVAKLVTDESVCVCQCLSLANGLCT